MKMDLRFGFVALVVSTISFGEGLSGIGGTYSGRLEDPLNHPSIFLPDANGVNQSPYAQQQRANESAKRAEKIRSAKSVADRQAEITKAASQRARAQYELTKFVREQRQAVPEELQERISAAEKKREELTLDLHARRSAAKKAGIRRPNLSTYDLERSQRELTDAKLALVKFEKDQAANYPTSIADALGNPDKMKMLPYELQTSIAQLETKPVVSPKQESQPQLLAGNLPEDLRNDPSCGAAVIPHQPVSVPNLGNGSRAATLELVAAYEAAMASNKPDNYVACKFDQRWSGAGLEKKGEHFFDVDANGNGYKIYFSYAKDEKGKTTGFNACRTSRVPCDKKISNETEKELTVLFAANEKQLRNQMLLAKKQGRRDIKLENKVAEASGWLAYHRLDAVQSSTAARNSLPRNAQAGVPSDTHGATEAGSW